MWNEPRIEGKALAGYESIWEDSRIGLEGGEAEGGGEENGEERIVHHVDRKTGKRMKSRYWG